MRRLAALTVIMLISLIVPISCCAPANESPVAYIDSINPDVAPEGEEISFSGHGIDPDGYIAGYRWTSSIDGLLAQVANFSESSLSTGVHNISFQVRDNRSVWSEEAIRQIVIGATTGLDEAITVVLEEILPDIDEIDDEEPYICYKLARSLYNGTVIEEDTESGLTIMLQEMIFFFYLDLSPGAEYPHPAMYILVDIDGNHDEYEVDWLPRINGAIPEELSQTSPDETYVIARNP